MAKKAQPAGVPEGATAVRHEDAKGRVGFVVSDGRVTTSNPIKVVKGAVCPACGAQAEGFRPPTEDRRYMDRIRAIRETHGIESDEEAHKKFLVDNGGYIHDCTECETSFFVKANVARVI